MEMRGETDPFSHLRQSSTVDQNNSACWVPSGKLISLSELPFELLSGIAVSIHETVYVKCLAYSRCQMSGVADMI